DGGFLINSSDAYVQQLAALPGLAGFYTADECLAGLQPGVFAQSLRLRRLAPATVTFSALLGNPDLTLWRDTVDILRTDPYPMYGAEPSGGYALTQVADWTSRARDAVKNARPYMTVEQFFQFTSLGRFPTQTEMRNMAYMAIVEGTHGLFWWSLGDNALLAVCSGWCDQKTGYMNNLKSVVNEIAALEPVLLADDAAGAQTTSSNTASKTKVKVVGGERRLGQRVQLHPQGGRHDRARHGSDVLLGHEDHCQRRAYADGDGDRLRGQEWQRHARGEREQHDAAAGDEPDGDVHGADRQ